MIQIQNTVAPFPVGIGKVVGASGTADEKVFDTKSVEGSDILTDKSPFEKQSGCPGTVGGCQTGAGAFLKSSSRQRSHKSDTRRGQIRFDGCDGSEAPAGFQIQTGVAVIVSSIGDGGQGAAGPVMVCSGVERRK